MLCYNVRKRAETNIHAGRCQACSRRCVHVYLTSEATEKMRSIFEAPPVMSIIKEDIYEAGRIREKQCGDGC